jgi:hypothetical protein
MVMWVMVSMSEAIEAEAPELSNLVLKVVRFLDTL